MKNGQSLGALCVDTAQPNEREEAFQILFQHLSAKDAEPRIANALEMIRRDELDPQGLFVVREKRSILGTIVCQLIPGGSGLVWPPQVREHNDKLFYEDQLINKGKTWLQNRGTKLAQALLAPDEVIFAQPLTRNAFRHITNLWYMRCKLDQFPGLPESKAELTYQTYRNCDRAVFQQTLLRTYEDSKDCPEVNGVRTIDEIITGHKAQGRHNPDYWWLASAEGHPVAVLLIAEVAEWQCWDLAYVGVAPEARRRGFGKELTIKALWEACQAQQTQLTLSVDARNHPALNLYRRLGFEPYDQRHVYLAIWKKPTG
ncbi:MAG TPA: GNAT family N-acetyltransferase [Gemmataceae bacterium]|jgi:ribosomal protein S18 acetylase RimI-like enzyme|nr:GNAT family N-acetyltransferase [Gemmataceae bacterium]